MNDLRKIVFSIFNYLKVDKKCKKEAKSYLEAISKQIRQNSVYLNESTIKQLDTDINLLLEKYKLGDYKLKASDKAFKEMINYKFRSPIQLDKYDIPSKRSFLIALYKFNNEKKTLKKKVKEEGQVKMFLFAKVDMLNNEEDKTEDSEATL